MDKSGGICSEEFWYLPLGRPEQPNPTAIYAPSKERIAELRAMHYDDYLRSPEWQERRRLEIQAAENACDRCGRRTERLHVHHLTYERRGHEHPDDLSVLCPGCHREAHGL